MKGVAREVHMTNVTRTAHGQSANCPQCFERYTRSAVLKTAMLITGTKAIRRIDSITTPAIHIGTISRTKIVIRIHIGRIQRDGLAAAAAVFIAPPYSD